MRLHQTAIAPGAFITLINSALQNPLDPKDRDLLKEMNWRAKNHGANAFIGKEQVRRVEALIGRTLT